MLPLLARSALEICHFDPETLKDNGVETCGKACYECLLDYGNQPDHKDLDRYLIRDLLAGMVAKLYLELRPGVTCRTDGRVAQTLRQPA